ncbi:hypothetical protein SAMN05192562_10371 [Kosakonia arachidis]|uniref:Uncharacterized protein n=1 Tax=Kosakonia arachidis TaxID=551989 RepID=A0A1I7BZT3_9ENTR|nr:hypothetical protein SAMN05192562_10371 [Kosakonia arachidis]
MFPHHTFNKLFIVVITALTEGGKGDAFIKSNGYVYTIILMTADAAPRV